MKKLIFIVSICLVGFTVSLNAGALTKFVKLVGKATKGKVYDVVKHIPSKGGLSKVINKNLNVPKIKPHILKDPNRILLINKADKIISKGDFEKKFFKNQSFDNQLATIVQSSKYGDKYFTIAKKVSLVSPSILKDSPKLLKYISANQLNQKNLQKKFIETLMHTGNAGWKRLKDISSWVAKYPKISATSGAFAWYALDPNSFEEALKSSGKTLGEFLFTIFANTASGVGSGIANKGEEMIDNIKNDALKGLSNSTPYLVNLFLGVFFFIGLFIAWRKRKIIHHFITKADEVKINTTKKEKDEF